MNWKYAIENKYICDYNFYYPNNDKIFDKINDLKIDYLKIDKFLLEKTILINKSYFLLESIKLLGLKKCIVYLKTIEESNNFFKILQIINLYFEINIKVYEITYNVTKKKRIEILNKFKNDNIHINILCNVHILDEGIDIQECDSVYLTHPNNNPINIIQRISRANRLDYNNINKIAKILVWSKNKIKLENIMNLINKTIDIKYGKEKNDCINSNLQEECNDKNKNIDIDNNYIYGNNDIKGNIDNNDIFINCISENKNINFNHSCKNCKKTFKYDYLLLKHYNRKNKCKSRILNKEENKNIKIYNINDNKNYRDIIKKINNFNKKIENHYNNSLKNEKNCYFCDKEFGTKGNLKRHMDLYCNKRKTLIEEKEKLLLEKEIFKEYYSDFNNKNDGNDGNDGNINNNTNNKNNKIINFNVNVNIINDKLNPFDIKDLSNIL